MRFNAVQLSLLVLLLAVITAPQAAEPRWVSLNQCIDQLLLRWAPDKLVGATYLSQSAVAQSSYPAINTHNGSLESILALQPTRVIATEFNRPDLVHQLRQYVPVTVLPQPQTWQDYQRWTQTLSDIGLTNEVAQHVSRMRSQFARLSGQSKAVVFVMPNQWSWGANSWADTLIQRLGWHNLTAELGQGLVALDLERLILMQPERVVLEGFSDHSFALANSWRHHPLLQQWLQQQQVVTIDSQTAACPVVNIGAYLNVLEGGHAERDE